MARLLQPARATPQAGGRHGSQFDTFTKHLAERSSRHRVIHGLSGLAAGLRALATKTYPYTHGGGARSLGLRGGSSGGTLPDPVVSRYADVDPADACVNLVGSNAFGGCGQDSYREFSDLAAGTYTIVATSVAPAGTVDDAAGLMREVTGW